MNPALGVVLRILGIGALVAGGVAVALAALAAVILFGPLLFWIACPHARAQDRGRRHKG